MTRPDPRSGFSLLEILIALSIFSLIVLSVTGFRSNLDVLQNIAYQRLESRQDMNQTIQILTREIRSAGPSSLGAYPIEAASTSSFTFYSDIDKDGLFERVRYFVPTSTAATTTLKKGVIKPTGNPLSYDPGSEIVTGVAENVVPSSTLPYFQYYDQNYTGSQAPLAYPLAPGDIRLVRFNLFVDIKPRLSPAPVFFSEVVSVRNLRSN